ncbi:MAG: hypothetical protein AB7U75_21865 [Hyphomicrobiaceae bacterium]
MKPHKAGVLLIAISMSCFIGLPRSDVASAATYIIAEEMRGHAVAQDKKKAHENAIRAWANAVARKFGLKAEGWSRARGRRIACKPVSGSRNKKSFWKCKAMGRPIRIVAARLYVIDTSGFGPSRQFAQQEAIRQWEFVARNTFGARYALWQLAVTRSPQCNGGNGVWRCNARALPQSI